MPTIIVKLLSMLGGNLLWNAFLSVAGKLVTQKLIERVMVKFFIWLADRFISSDNNKLEHSIFQPVREALVEMDK